MAGRPRHIHALPNGYQLHWYEIDDVLGQGGFGITYLAHDINLNQRVAIKEFLPTDLSVRTEGNDVAPVSEDLEVDYKWGLARFIREAQTLARFKHPNIVAVNAVFQENNTAYLVMEYVEGEVFADAMRARKLKKEERLLELLHALLDGLELIHEAGYIHRDIKPDNIYLRADGTPVLLDFGSARQAFGARTETMAVPVSPGYAPYEQYDSSADLDKQGAWTDIYALGATFYRAVTGHGPVEAIVRMHAVLDGSDRLHKVADVGRGWYTDRFLNAIDTALNFRPADRPQSVAQWRELLPGRPGEDDPDDDSGMDLLLIAEEAAPERVEETLILQAPLVEDAAERDAAEDAVQPSPESVKRGPSVDPYAETVIHSAPLLQELSSAPAPEPVAKESDVEPAVDPREEETAILAERLVDGDGDGLLPASTPVAEAEGSREKQTVTFEAPAESDADQPDEFDGYPAVSESHDEEAAATTIINASSVETPEPHVLDPVTGSVVQPEAAPEQESKIPKLRIPGNLPTLIGIGAVAVLLVALLWWTGSQTHSSRVPTHTLTPEQLEALKQQRENAEQEQLQTEQKLQAEVAELLTSADADIRGLRLTSPPGDNALERLQRVLELDPTNAEVNPRFEAIVQAYIELSNKAATSGDLKKAEAYLDKMETVHADSPAIAKARAALAALAAARNAEADRERAAEPVEEVVEHSVAEGHVCAPRKLEPRASAFPQVLSALYRHAAFANVPALRVRWVDYESNSIINNHGRETSMSRYEVIDVDGVSARVRKRHKTSFDNGVGSVAFEESADGQHVQVLGGLLSPVDTIRSHRETTIIRDGVSNTTTTDTNATTVVTRVYEVSGQLFPLEIGNYFSFKTDRQVTTADGNVQKRDHEGKPYLYYVNDVIPGSEINGRLSCDVYVVDYNIERHDYLDTGKLYFSVELGLVAKQVGQSVHQLSDGRAVSRSYQRAIVDFASIE